MLKVQEFLYNYVSSRETANSSSEVHLDAISALKDEYGIKASFDPDRPHVVALNYDQIASPKTNPIVRECRGLILYLPSFDVASRSFTRFYNYGEVLDETGQVDFTKAVITEKMDGSLINVYYDNTLLTWTVSTRGTVNAANAFTKNGTPYLKLICDALNIVADTYCKGEDEYYLPSEILMYYNNLIDEKLEPHLDKELTYIFELVSPEIEIVTRYNETNLYFLGARNIKTGNEPVAVPSINALDMVKFPKTYNVDNKEDTLALLNSLNVNSDRLIEGFVVHDIEKGIRTKLKNNVYLQAHRMSDGCMDEKNILQLIIENDEEEFLLYYPELRDSFNKYINARDIALTDAQTTYEKAKMQKDSGIAMKELATWLKGTNVGDMVLPMLGRNITSSVIMFSNMNEKSRIGLIKKYL